MQTTSIPTKARELARRSANGVVVTLFWVQATDEIVVRYSDERTGERFDARVPRADALDAFNHPNAYR